MISTHSRVLYLAKSQQENRSYQWASQTNHAVWRRWMHYLPWRTVISQSFIGQMTWDNQIHQILRVRFPIMIETDNFFIFWKTLHYMNINKSRIGGSRITSLGIGGSRNLWKMGALSIYIWVLIEKEGGPNLHLFLINMHMKFGGLLRGKKPLDHPLGQLMSWVRDRRA